MMYISAPHLDFPNPVAVKIDMKYQYFDMIISPMAMSVLADQARLARSLSCQLVQSYLPESGVITCNFVISYGWDSHSFMDAVAASAVAVIFICSTLLPKLHEVLFFTLVFAELQTPMGRYYLENVTHFKSSAKILQICALIISLIDWNAAQWISCVQNTDS